MKYDKTNLRQVKRDIKFHFKRDKWDIDFMHEVNRALPEDAAKVQVSVMHDLLKYMDKQGLELALNSGQTKNLVIRLPRKQKRRSK